MTKMDIREFAAGEILFREGDASDNVLRLISGEVEIQREAGGRPIILGYVNEGEFIGEMGVIENLPRIATAHALTDGFAEVLTVDQFFDRISGDFSTARELILRLSIRLRKADDELVRLTPQPSIQPEPAETVLPEQDVAAVPLFAIAADTLELQLMIGAEPRVATQLPFVVGRLLTDDEAKPQHVLQIALKDTRPYRISRNHFMIDGEAGQMIVRDLNSTMGTTVNGQAIGHHFKADSSPLHPGVNKIIAGGRDSPFQFTVTVD